MISTVSIAGVLTGVMLIAVPATHMLVAAAFHLLGV